MATAEEIIESGLRRVKSVMGHAEEIANIYLKIIPFESGQFLKKYGNVKITSLRIGKTKILPDVLSGVSKALVGENIVHTYFIINGTYLLERYNIVIARELTQPEQHELFKKLYTSDEVKGRFENVINVQNEKYFKENKITIHQLIANYAHHLGSENNAWQHYNAAESNCQHFCLNVLMANCIPVTKDIEDFTLQDVVCKRIAASKLKKAAAHAASSGIRAYAVVDKAAQCLLQLITPEEAASVAESIDYKPANFVKLRQLNNAPNSRSTGAANA
jgi:hypothetical protein